MDGGRDDTRAQREKRVEVSDCTGCIAVFFLDLVSRLDDGRDHSRARANSQAGHGAQNLASRLYVLLSSKTFDDLVYLGLEGSGFWLFLKGFKRLAPSNPLKPFELLYPANPPESLGLLNPSDPPEPFKQSFSWRAGATCKQPRKSRTLGQKRTRRAPGKHNHKILYAIRV